MLVLTHHEDEAVDEHKLMFDAALGRNIELASQSLKSHVENGLSHTLKHFNV